MNLGHKVQRLEGPRRGLVTFGLAAYSGFGSPQAEEGQCQRQGVRRALGDTEGGDEAAMGWIRLHCPSEREEFSPSVLMLLH